MVPLITTGSFPSKKATMGAMSDSCFDVAPGMGDDLPEFIQLRLTDDYFLAIIDNCARDADGTPSPNFGKHRSSIAVFEEVPEIRH